MRAARVFYTDEFVLPLPPGHRFPMTKYRRLREQLLASGVLSDADLAVPEGASDEQLLRVHDADYVTAVRDGTLSAAHIRRIGFPWSPQLVERSRRSVGATIAASRVALTTGVGVNLAGGTHHAFADRGEGYCVFNDVAVAIREARAAGQIRRALVVDCDVHQGNGTASIFRDDPDVFTLSLHGRSNYPFHKEPSNLDVALEDGTGDEEYAARLQEALGAATDGFAADLVYYVAGADPYEGDRLGRLALTREGLAERDRIVCRAAQVQNSALVVVMAGGYCPDVDAIAAIHGQTVAIALSSTRCEGAPETHPGRESGGPAVGRGVRYGCTDAVGG